MGELATIEDIVNMRNLYDDILVEFLKDIQGKGTWNCRTPKMYNASIDEIFAHGENLNIHVTGFDVSYADEFSGVLTISQYEAAEALAGVIKRLNVNPDNVVEAPEAK